VLNTAWAIFLIISFKKREAKVKEVINSIDNIRKSGLYDSIQYETREILA
jgi:hypothetical protein